MVVNAVGSATIGDGPHFWAAACEVGAEFGGLGYPPHVAAGRAWTLRMKGGAPPSTTLALVVTDARLTKAQAKRVAIMADDGLARAIRPAHAPMDGDTVFAVATLPSRCATSTCDLTEIGLAAADCLARAIARGVYEATALPFPGAVPAWRDRFAPRGLCADEPGQRSLLPLPDGGACSCCSAGSCTASAWSRPALTAAAPGTADACGPPCRLRAILRRATCERS